MKRDSKAMLEVLPDFEDLMELAENIEKLSIAKARLESEIQTREVEVVREVTTNPTYFQGGKIPSMGYITSTYKYSGLSNELVDKRLALATLEATISKYKMQMDVYKTMMDIWRTLSSNERKSVI